MGFWFWFWICCGVVLIGIVLQVLALLRLASKAKGLIEPAKRLEAIGRIIEQTGSTPVNIESPVAALDQDIEQVFTRRQALLKQRRLRKEDRQRRLVARLKEVRYDESRLR